MPRQKNYKTAIVQASLHANLVASPALQERPATARIHFAELLGDGVRTAGPRGVDLTEWLGRGLDHWVWSVIDAYIAKLRSGTAQTSTINNESRGMAKFFEFLMEAGAQPLIAHPRDVSPLHMTQFVSWLRRRQEARNLSSETTRSAYKGVKSTLVTLMDHGVIAADPKRFFPVHVLPHKNFAPSRAQPYSEAEQQRLADALRADLIDLHHGRLRLPGAAVQSIYFLIVAMRTGSNFTPLIELRRDGMRPGLLPGTQYLQLEKHRAAKIVTRVLKRKQSVEPPLPIPMDAVAVLERALKDTAELARQAPPHLQNQIWLFRSQARGEEGVIKRLRRETVDAAIRALAKRRSLVDDAGKPLLVLTTRLRQSLSKRAWRLSDGDPMAVAAILGNTPRVADSEYLRIDEQLKTEAATYMGRELSLYLRVGPDGPGPTPAVVADNRTIKISTLTPTGRCKDSLYGEHAPKNGDSHCDQFVLCLFCPSFAVVGHPEDLWRLYSFQRFALAEVAQLAALHGDHSADPSRQGLRELYEAAIPFIDQFCERSFGVKLSAEAKARVTREVHPFWAHMMKRSELRRTGPVAGEIDNG